MTPHSHLKGNYITRHLTRRTFLKGSAAGLGLRAAKGLGVVEPRRAEENAMGMLKALSTAVMLMATTVALAAEGRVKIAYSTYLGGNQWEEAREIIVYPDGSVLVDAHVCSSGLPTTTGCLQPNYAGDDPTSGPAGLVGGDMYFARLRTRMRSSNMEKELDHGC